MYPRHDETTVRAPAAEHPRRAWRALEHGVAQLRRGLLQCRQRHEAEVAAPRRRLRILREVCGDVREGRACLQPLHHHLQLGRRLLRCGRVVAGPVGNPRVPDGGDDELRDAVRVLGAVELRAVGVEERRDVLVVDRDFRHDLALEQFAPASSGAPSRMSPGVRFRLRAPARRFVGDALRAPR
jgi:hypothetical protein